MKFKIDPKWGVVSPGVNVFRATREQMEAGKVVPTLVTKTPDERRAFRKRVEKRRAKKGYGVTYAWMQS